MTFSSTYIRACIDAGDVAAAAAALGRPHRVEGVVVHGDHRGRELGFPTANVASAAWTALPADGVYAGRFVLGARRLPSAISVGTNPTFSGRERTVEVFVLDIDEDFYGFDVGRGRRALAARAGALRRHRRADGPDRTDVDAHPRAARSMIFPKRPRRQADGLSASGAWRRRLRANRARQRELYGAPLGDRVRTAHRAAGHLAGPPRAACWASARPC